jgi:hypothetical protein
MNKLQQIFLAIIFLISACSPVGKLKESPAVKWWEPDIARFDSLDQVTMYPSDAIIFAGSSSIRLWTTLSSDMEPFHVIQRGYGGAKFSDFAVYADRIFSAHQCKAAVLFIANDITGAADDKSPEEVRKLFLYALKTFRKSHPSAPFFYIEITPTPLRWKAWPMISRANELIRSECERHANTYYISTSSSFLDENGSPKNELFRSDKLHQNADGYKIWSSIIKAELMKRLGN